jgi:hypothetical protein
MRAPGRRIGFDLGWSADANKRPRQHAEDNRLNQERDRRWQSVSGGSGKASRFNRG